MAEIDMIPASYHRTQRVGISIHRFGVASGAVLALGVLMFAALSWRIAYEAPILAHLRAATGRGEAVTKELQVLAARKNALQERLAVFAALRGAGDVARTLTAIDQALPAGVWFKQMQFYRDEQMVPAKAVRGGAAALAQSGISVVVPIDAAGKASTTDTTTWRLGKNLDIAGEALDHAALSAFLHSLEAQPDVATVQFLKSSAQLSEGEQFVSFNLTMRAGMPKKAAP